MVNEADFGSVLQTRMASLASKTRSLCGLPAMAQKEEIVENKQPEPVVETVSSMKHEDEEEPTHFEQVSLFDVFDEEKEKDPEKEKKPHESRQMTIFDMIKSGEQSC